MKVLRYLAIAALLGGAIAALLAWQQRAPDRPATNFRSNPEAAKAKDIQNAPARSTSAPEPATNAHRQAAESLAELLTLPSQFEQNARLYELIMASDIDELLALIDEAAHLASRMDCAAALQILLSRYVELAPKQAIARAKQLRSKGDQHLVTGLYISWIRNDEAGAVRYLLTQPKGLQAQIAATLQAVNQSSGDNRYQDAFEALAAGDSKKSSNASQLAQQAGEDPASAWSAALAETNLRERQNAMQSVLQVWARNDPESALNAVASLPSHQRNRMQMNVVGRWLQQDSDAALTWITAQAPGLRSNQLYSMAVTHLAQTDLPQALRVAATLPQTQSQRLIDQALSRMVSSNPDQVIEELNNAGIDLASSRAYAQVLSNANLYSLEESLRRASQLDNSQREQVEQRLYRRWAEEDPAAAARHLLSNTDPAHNQRSIRQVIRRWANADPAAAASWIATAPDTQRDQMQQVLVSTISQMDPDSALSYLADIRSPSHHDTAAVSIMSQLIMDLPAAEAVLEKMQTDAGRQQGSALLYRALKQFNAPEAERFKPSEPSTHPGVGSTVTHSGRFTVSDTSVQIN